MVKGIGYILESMLSIFIILAFVIGGLQITGLDQNWNNFEAEIASEDINMVLSKTGNEPNFLSRGDSGSLSTTVSSITEKDYTVNSRITGLPSFTLTIGNLVKSENVLITNSFETLSDSNSNHCSESDLNPVFDLSGGLSYNGSFIGSEIYLGESSQSSQSRVYLNQDSDCEVTSRNIYEIGDIADVSGYEYYIDRADHQSDLIEIYNVTLNENVRDSISGQSNSISIKPDMVYTEDLSDISENDVLLAMEQGYNHPLKVRLEEVNNIQPGIVARIKSSPSGNREMSSLQAITSDYDVYNGLSFEPAGKDNRYAMVSYESETDSDVIKSISSAILWVSIERQAISNNQFTQYNLDREIHTVSIDSLESGGTFMPYRLDMRWGY